MALMSFTLDSLIVKDVQNQRRLSSGVYLTIGIIIFLFGLFNNYCSLVTFIRPKPRKVGIGNYLLIVSILNQCSLLFLLLKITEIVVGSTGLLFNYESFNLYSCKIVSYLLSVFTRISYWLTSLVSIERCSIVLFPTSFALRRVSVAVALSAIVIVTVCGMHIHELIYYTTILDESYRSANITLCATNYVQQFVSIYNRVNVLIHYFVSFLIQFISVTVLIVQTTRHRQRAVDMEAVESRQTTCVAIFQKKFQMHKEYYLAPIIIILSALPQAIFSFTYACTELKYEWQRYTLLTTYFLSYLPQMFGFIVYVLPSTAYKEEFQKTLIGRKLFRGLK